MSPWILPIPRLINSYSRILDEKAKWTDLISKSIYYSAYLSHIVRYTFIYLSINLFDPSRVRHVVKVFFTLAFIYVWSIKRSCCWQRSPCRDGISSLSLIGKLFRLNRIYRSYRTCIKRTRDSESDSSAFCRILTRRINYFSAMNMMVIKRQS